MFKFALAAGITYEWVTGPMLVTVFDFAHAILQTLLATLVAWMVLEVCRSVYRMVMSFDDGRHGAASKPPAS